LKSHDLVSIIIPCYNYGAYVADAIGSLQAQSYEHWEAIVVDDGSTDNTASQVAALANNDDRIIYVHQSNKGVSAARNAGMALAKGEIVQFLDADDLLSSNKLHAHVEHFRCNPSTDISYSKFRYFSDENPGKLYSNYKLSSVTEWSKPVTGEGNSTFPAFIKKNNLPIQAAMFRRDFLKRVGEFDLGMHALEDWDFLLRCILRGALMAGVTEPTAMTLIRVHPGSATRNIAFSDYIDRVYGNVKIEIQRLQENGNLKEVMFYEGVLRDALHDLNRKRMRSMRKAEQRETMQSILNQGLLNFKKFYPEFKSNKKLFFNAYLRALAKRLSKFFE
jgi:glycosyltransferase involved in cell wall biosynthesis